MGLGLKSTWGVAVSCAIILAVSLAFERLIHYTGKYLKKKNQKPLFDALQKVKEELMLLGFISLMLAVFDKNIPPICVSKSVKLHFLPCEVTKEGGSEKSKYCASNGKVELLPTEDLSDLHEFLFVLAVVHAISSVLTVVIGGARIRQWKNWEASFANASSDESSEQGMLQQFTFVREHDFIKHRFTGIEKYSTFIGWLQCFLRQFYGSVSKADYEALRRGFIITHCNENPKFDFNKYMLRALADDFSKLVGISWYMWVFVVIILLLNISKWHTDFVIAFIPVILLLAVGTKLEHVITQLAHDIAEKHIAIEGELVVKPSDDHFWFRRPQIILFLIHFILVQNAFEITFLFWFFINYGFHACIRNEVRFILARLIIGVVIRLHCSYCILPLYALVTQMGTHFKRSVFDELVQDGIVVLNDVVNSSPDHGGGGGSTVDSAPGGLQIGGISRFNPDGGNPQPEIEEVDDEVKSEIENYVIGYPKSPVMSNTSNRKLSLTPAV